MGPALGNLHRFCHLWRFSCFWLQVSSFTLFAGSCRMLYPVLWQFQGHVIFKIIGIYFFTYLGIGIVVFLLITVWTLVIIGIPAGVTGSAAKDPFAAITVSKIMAVWAIRQPLCFLVADRARVWVATTGIRKVPSSGGRFLVAADRFQTVLPCCAYYFSPEPCFSGPFAFTASCIARKGINVNSFLFFPHRRFFIIRIFMKAWRYAI